MADDSDPFGVPPSFLESLTITSIFALVFLIGLWLVSGFKIIKSKLK